MCRVQFSGIATAELPELSCAPGSPGLTTCATERDKTWVAEVANVTWTTLDGLRR